MTHEEIERNEIVDAYLLEQLADDEREAFEEHFFACDACFAQVQERNRFVQGVRQAAESGALPALPHERAVSSWLQPAFALSIAAVVVLSAVTGWLAFVRVPRLRLEAEAQQRMLDEARRSGAEREQQIAVNRLPAVEANLPLVMLEASRAADANNTLTIPSGASNAVLWIEPGPDARSPTFRLEIRTAAGEAVETIHALVRNRYGALSASLPTERLNAGTYVVRLFGADGALVSEYRLQIRR